MIEQNMRNYRICHDCVRDDYLREKINNARCRKKCEYCGYSRNTMSLAELSEFARHALTNHYILTDEVDGWEWHEYTMSEGTDIETLICELTDVKQKVATDIVRILSHRYSYYLVKNGGIDPYGGTSEYMRRQINEWSLNPAWYKFQNEIRMNGRFFNSNAEDMLKEIFGNLNKLAEYGNGEFIRGIEPDRPISFWRARYAESPEDLERILKSAHAELGPPPGNAAKAGRMNAEGISVFYGAEDLETCVAEVRAPVGSDVVCGKFEVIRPLRLIDLGELTRIEVKGSVFDPDFVGVEDQAAFFKRLTNEISRPVMPRDELDEYLVTQVVAEYLANRNTPTFDGMLYPSSQTGRSKGNNVVLFHHASKLEPYEIERGSRMEIDWSYEMEYEHEFSQPRPTGNVEIAVNEWPPDQEMREKFKWEDEKYGWMINDIDRGEGLDSNRTPTLRLDLNSLTTLNIEEMVPKFSEITTSYHKFGAY